MSKYLETEEEIFFYSHHGYKYACFSNFYPVDFTVDGIKFNCSEQYLMYHKCLTFDKDNICLLSEILNERDPKKIKQFGRSVRNYNEQIWNRIRQNIMIQGLVGKFSQSSELCEILLNTGDKIIYEASKYDRIWGIGYYPSEIVGVSFNNFGMNLLGKSLMETRRLIKI